LRVGIGCGGDERFEGDMRVPLKRVPKIGVRTATMSESANRRSIVCKDNVESLIRVKFDGGVGIEGVAAVEFVFLEVDVDRSVSDGSLGLGVRGLVRLRLV